MFLDWISVGNSVNGAKISGGINNDIRKMGNYLDNLGKLLTVWPKCA